MIASWSGQPNNHLNPSEWGTLILKREVSWFSKIIISVIIIIVILLLLYVRKRNKIIPISPVINYTQQEVLVNKAVSYMQENSGKQSLNRDKVAAYLKISCTHLSSIFKKNTGKSLPEYINELRIVEAERLLININKKITEIAFETGFSTLDHFIRVFKDSKGVTPNNFRKNQ